MVQKSHNKYLKVIQSKFRLYFNKRKQLFFDTHLGEDDEATASKYIQDFMPTSEYAEAVVQQMAVSVRQLARPDKSHSRE